MEALEQVFAERAEDLISCRCTRRELTERGETVADLSRCARAARVPSDDANVAWSSVNSLLSNEQLFVPFELVSLDMRADSGWDFSAMPVSSIGLAAGTSWEGAATHALLEVLEHNSTAAIDIFGFLPGLARPVGYRCGSDPALDEIVLRLKRAGFDYQLYDLSSPHGLPVIAALIDCADLSPGWIQFGGFACRFCPEHAAEAALLEAIQSRLTMIAGARDDLNFKAYRGHTRSSAQGQQSRLFLHELTRNYAWLRCAPAAKQLQAAIHVACSLGAEDIWAASLGRIEGLVSVVRIIAPGIEVSGLNAPTSLGRRTLSALLSVAAARQ